jgi:hypothetical protein
MRESPTAPLTAVEAVALLGSALAGLERSAHRVWFRSVDLATANPGLRGKSSVRQTEELLDLAGEVETVMQLMDRLYQHLSALYFDVVGQDD